MPSYEMPLEEMKEYRGSSPCPKDFDTYWSDALAELDAVKPEPILKPAAFQAAGTECFDLYFKGVRGAKIHAKLLMPQHSAGKSPALLYRQCRAVERKAGIFRSGLCGGGT